MLISRSKEEQTFQILPKELKRGELEVEVAHFYFDESNYKKLIIEFYPDPITEAVRFWVVCDGVTNFKQCYNYLYQALDIYNHISNP